VAIAVMTVLSGLTLFAVAPRAPATAHGSMTAAPSAAALTPVAASPDMGWQPPVALESQTSTYANLAGIALSTDGTGMIVWQKGGVRGTLMATQFLPSGGGDGGTDWRVPVQISNSQNDIGYAYNGAVAMDGAGGAMAVYYTWSDLHGYTIYAAHYKGGVGWQAPVPIDQPYDYSYSPVVAMNHGGVAFVVWEVWNGAYYSIFANRYLPGTGWGTALAIESTANYSYSPRVAVDAAGNAIATWYANDGGTLHVYGARFSTTVGWLAPFNLETSTNYAFYPSVAMDSKGNGIVAWIEFDGQYNIWAKRYDNSTGWAPATMIEPGTYSAYSYPGPAVAASNGNASVVWTMSDASGTPNVFVNRYIVGSGWVGPSDIDQVSVPAQNGLVGMDPTGNVTITYTYEPTSPANAVVDSAVRFDHVTSSWSYSQLDYERVGSGSPLVAIDGSGNALAAWNYNAGSTTTPQNGILANIYTAGSGWLRYYQAQQASWEGQISPSWLQLETNTAGDAIFSFTQDDGPIWDGYAALYTPGGGWGPVTRIENFNASGVTEEWSAIDGAGNALVLFRASDGAQYNVYATYYSVGTGWGTPHRLDSAAGDNKFWLRVAMNERGDGVAIWEEYNGTNWNDYAAFFNGTTQTWGAPGAIQSAFAYLGTAAVGIDGKGDAMAVYDAYNGTGYTNYASYYQPGVGWQAAVQIAHGALSANDIYAVAMNGAGDVAVSWTAWNGTRNLAVANVFAPGTGWGTDTSFNSGPGDEGAATPSLDGVGDTMFAYNVWDGTQYVAYAVLKLAGGAWGTPVRLSSGSGDVPSLVTALDYRGDGFAVWTQYNGYGYDIVSRRYVAAEGWMPQVTVNLPAPATPATDTGSPIVGTDGHGNGVLGWNEWENGALLPFASIYVTGNGLPSLSLASPANGTLTNDSSVTVSGTTDPGVTLTIDGSGVVVAANGSFSKTYVLPSGSHAFVVVAKDAAGLTTELTSSVTVDTAAPSLTISSPITGSLTKNPVAVVIGTAEVGSTVDVNGVQAVVSPAGGFSVALPLQEGPNTITAIATDPAGNSATSSVTVTLDTVPPALSLISPASSLTNRSAVVVSGTTEPGATLTVDGSPVSVGVSGAFATTLSLVDGPHTIVVVATDAAGNQASLSVPITVDTTAPSLSIASPTTGSLTKDPVAEVTGTTEIGATVAVNGVQSGVSSSGGFTVALPLQEGLNTITATATDAAGNTATTSVTVTLDTVAPPLTLTSPAQSLTNHSAVVVAGTTEAGATVTVDGTAVSVNGSGGFTTILTLTDGLHTIVVVATDAAGNQATVSARVTVDTTPPALTVTSPIAGASVSSPEILVSGTAVPGSTVVVNGYAVAVTSGGTFSIELPLSPGANTILVTETDQAGNVASRTIPVSYDNPVPAAQASINSLNTLADVLIAVAAAGLALGILQIVRGRKPKVGSAEEWKEHPPEGPAP